MIDAMVNSAVQMKQIETAMSYSVAVEKKSQDIIKMQGNAAIELIQSSSCAASKAMGLGNNIDCMA